MPIDASFAGAGAGHGDWQITVKENYSWRATHDETQSARQDGGASTLFQTIIGGLPVGTEIGQSIGASNGEPGNATKDIDLFGNALKNEKIDHEKEEIGAMRQEAAQRYDAAMDSAGKEMWTGLASGSTHIGENIVRADLAQTDLAIKYLLEEISDLKQKENDIQDAKAHDQETSNATQNIEKAVSSLNQIQSAVGSVLGDQNPSQPTTQSQGSHDESSSQAHFELPAMTRDNSHHWPL